MNALSNGIREGDELDGGGEELLCSQCHGSGYITWPELQVLQCCSVLQCVVVYCSEGTE